MLLVIGLAFIIVGWIIQIYKTAVQKDKTLNSLFLILYVIGVLFLVVGNFLIYPMKLQRKLISYSTQMPKMHF